MRRVGIIVAVLVVVWLVLLLVLGGLYGERKAQAIADRIGEALQADATMADHDLALVRGRLVLERMQVKREDLIGKLTLEVGEIRCELIPLGGALVDGSCRELAIGGVRLELTTFELFKLKNPTRPPIRADRVTIENAVLVFSPAAVVPELGRVTLTIDRATAGATTMRTPLSWIFHLETLEATVELPVGKIRLDYKHGRLSASGGVLGSKPVSVPFAPVASLADETAGGELKRLAEVGKELAEQLVEQKVRDWLRKR